MEVWSVSDYDLVGSHQNVERRVPVVGDVLAIPELAKNLSVFRRAPVWQYLQVGNELCNLLLPIVQRTGGSDDQEWAPDVVLFGEVGHNRDRLHRLAETHLICQDTVDALLIQVDQPVESFDLILLECTRQHLWLGYVHALQGCRVLEVHLSLIVKLGRAISVVVLALFVECLGAVLRLLDSVLRICHCSILEFCLILCIEIEILEVRDLVSDSAVREVDGVLSVGVVCNGLTAGSSITFACTMFLDLICLHLFTDEVRVQFRL